MKNSVRSLKHSTIYRAKAILKTKPKTKKAIIKSIRLTEKFISIQILDKSRTYEAWLKNHTPTQDELTHQRTRSAKFVYRPLISIVTPVYNTSPKMLQECIESVINQTYTNWELVLVDDKSTNTAPVRIMKDYANKDSRIKTVFNKKNMHIAGATNAGIQISKGEYIALLDHDDVLYPHALFSVVASLQTKKHDFIYSDEDKLSANGKKRKNPFFKPDWSPDYLRSINYITHFTVIKKTLINKVGGLRAKCDGAQDWDLFLRTTRQAKSIYHIQDVLYGWRMSNNSTAQETEAKPYVVAAQKKALQDDVLARGLNANIVQSRYVKDYWEVNYTVKGTPKVSIVIPTKNQYKVVKRCIDSIFEKTTYSNYEIVLVDTGSTDADVLEWYKELRNNKKIHLHSWVEPRFSYANACNFGAENAKGKYLVMLNNDTEVITKDWLELMLGDAQRPEVGTVGAKLLFPGNKIIQHAGIGVGLGGYAANVLGGSAELGLNSTQILYLNNKRNVAANTAACIMVRKKLFNDHKGFDNTFSVTYNDVDLGLRILNSGYVNIYNPAVVLTHHESISLGMPEDIIKRDTKEFLAAKSLLRKKWNKLISHDPYLNKNYSKGRADFTLIK